MLQSNRTMKTTKAIQLLILLIFVSTQITAQITISSNELNPENDAQHPCITPQEYQILQKECAKNIKLFKLDKKHRNQQTVNTALNWPIRAAAGFNDCDYYFIAAYVDQDIATGTFQDFACGTNTYDGHHGTDIASWPFSFYKMDNSQVEVVAAAAGTIVQKVDANFDRNCSSNTLTANSIIIQHADGTLALYWHMKKNSLTTKVIGQTVVAGEFLGVVGSSGSASGPHLHFEVWAGATNTTYNDPFAGSCNTLNANSWWAAQKPHTNPAVIKVSVNTTDIVLPGCPTTETPNESDTFTIPFQGPGLGPGYAKFYIYIRDDVAGLSADCKILNPNGTTFNSWIYTSAANNKAAIKGYSKLLPTIPGVYTFQATYNGQTCSKTFTIVSALANNEFSHNEQIKLYPNPTTGKIFISFNNTYQYDNIMNLSFYNVAGQLIKKFMISPATKEIELNIPTGIYFYNINSENGNLLKTCKIIVD